MGAAAARVEVLRRRQRLSTTSSQRGAQVVLELGLDQQLLEHLRDVEVLLGGHLDEPVLPFHGDQLPRALCVHLESRESWQTLRE